MHVRHRLLVVASLALSGAAVLAQQPHIRPGLWEETLSMKTDDAQANAAMEQMKQRMASMPPEQRAAIEKMMAGRGLGMGALCLAQLQLGALAHVLGGAQPLERVLDNVARDLLGAPRHLARGALARLRVVDL